jgi:PAS domain-containing protein
VVPVEVHYSVLVDGDRRTYVAFARDISDRARADASLRESERQYRELSARLKDRVIERTGKHLHARINDVLDLA